MQLAIKAALATRREEAIAALAATGAEQVGEREAPAYGPDTDNAIDALVDLLLELAKHQNEY